MRPPTLFLLLVASVALNAASQADDPPSGGLSPDEALARMTLPDGFHAELFASEPEIRQPVAATFDERGRLWVVEYLQYPTPAGVKPVTVDQYLRTEYDKLPDPPPHGPKGADRIKILEDTDGDGKADKVTTFVDGLNLASGVAIGYGGVFVANAPYLIFYPDKDRNDVPDGPPEVLLSGFGIQDAHAVINSLTWGPDGWLYGAQGSTVTAKVNGYEFQQGIWRYHPVSKKFELFAEGGGNTWGVDFDAAGNLFGSSNGSFIAFHMVQGGYYWKGFAKHGPLHNPRAYGYFNAIEFNGQKPGGHVTPGGIIYKGGAYPPEFDGAFIGPNLLSNSVYWYKLAPKGSTFTMSLGGTLLDSHDKWFRPIDALTGPDGCVYIVDWYDRRASHLDPRDNWDRTNGRIYRLVYGERKKVEPFDLATWPTEDLLKLNNHENAWWPESALRILFERRDANATPRLLEQLRTETDPTVAVRLLWALDGCGGLDSATAISLLSHPCASVRANAVHSISLRDALNPAAGVRLLDIAQKEPDRSVLGAFASLCQQFPKGPNTLVLILLLASRTDIEDDPFLPLQLWWALERITRHDMTQTEYFLLEDHMRLSGVVKSTILERLARLLAAHGDAAGYRALFTLWSLEVDGATRARIRQAIDESFQGESLAKMDEETRMQWHNRIVAELINTLRAPEPSTEPILNLRMRVRLGPASATREAVERIKQSDTPDQDRISLISLIGERPSHENEITLRELLSTTLSDSCRAALIRTLSRFESDDLPEVLIAGYSINYSPARAEIIRALCSRKSWISPLLDAIEANKIPAKDLTPAHVLLAMQQNDPALNARLEKLWGKLPGPGTPEKDRRIAEVRGMLPEGDKGDPKRGHKVFQENCMNCHRLFGEGQAIGPDLSGAERGDLEFLLASTVDPSRVMRKEYQPVTVATKDGRVLTGLIVEQNDQYMVLFDSAQQKTTIPRSDIEETRDATVSVMPEGILDKLQESQIRDLFRYLQSNGP